MFVEVAVFDMYGNLDLKVMGLNQTAAARHKLLYPLALLMNDFIVVHGASI